DSLGCKVRSDEVQVCVDGLPSGYVHFDSIACHGGMASYFDFTYRPVGRVDSIVIRQARYKHENTLSSGVSNPTYTTLTFGRSYLSSNSSIHLPLTWGSVGGLDSCLTFEVLEMWDKYGCRMEQTPLTYDSLYRAKVNLHWEVEIDVEVRRPGRSDWESGIHNVSLDSKDSLEVKVSLTQGTPVWSLQPIIVGNDTLRFSPISKHDTVFWLKTPGLYKFVPYDMICGVGLSSGYDLTLSRLDTGYIRGRVFLEGVFDASNGIMVHGDCNTGRLLDSLKLPTSLPLLPSNLYVIDWIEVELRVGQPKDSVALMTDSTFFLSRDTCLLLSDGHLADRRSGDTIVGIRNAYAATTSQNNRYVAIRHRNHLGVMTGKVYSFVGKSNKVNANFIDFTDTLNIYRRSATTHRMDYHMTRMSSGGRTIWCLSAGELNTNYLVSLMDPNRVTLVDIYPNGGQQGYRYDLLHDINLDGCVDWPGWNGTAATDWLFVERNRQKFTEIRWDR
ncbi:hypothetical protein, partial [Odoribacter lunatus]|uniref:hypothetical protein n=1 Tax=Odoribacter lunatus TaxID=2941335 RepID=UPI002041FD83